VIGLHYLRTDQSNQPSQPSQPSRPSQPNPANERAGSAQGVPAVAPKATTSNTAARQVIKPSATVRESQLAKPQGRTDWRVVAYTYNHVNQAQEKVKTIEQRHPELNPEVFTPNGLATLPGHDWRGHEP